MLSKKVTVLKYTIMWLSIHRLGHQPVYLFGAQPIHVISCYALVFSLIPVDLLVGVSLLASLAFSTCHRKCINGSKPLLSLCLRDYLSYQIIDYETSLFWAWTTKFCVTKIKALYTLLQHNTENTSYYVSEKNLPRSVSTLVKSNHHINPETTFPHAPTPAASHPRLCQHQHSFSLLQTFIIYPPSHIHLIRLSNSCPQTPQSIFLIIHSTQDDNAYEDNGE